jgi:hypothetical protein
MTLDEFVDWCIARGAKPDIIEAWSRAVRHSYTKWDGEGWIGVDEPGENVLGDEELLDAVQEYSGAK